MTEDRLETRNLRAVDGIGHADLHGRSGDRERSGGSVRNTCDAGQLTAQGAGPRRHRHDAIMCHGFRLSRWWPGRPRPDPASVVTQGLCEGSGRGAAVGVGAVVERLIVGGNGRRVASSTPPPGERTISGGRPAMVWVCPGRRRTRWVRSAPSPRWPGSSGPRPSVLSRIHSADIGHARVTVFVQVHPSVGSARSIVQWLPLASAMVTFTASPGSTGSSSCPGTW